MYFNSGNQSIVRRLNRAASSDDVVYPLIDKANDINEALDRFWLLASHADGTFQLDDINYTDFPISTTNLVSGQQDYSLPSDVLSIEKVLVKDSSSNWYTLQPVDIQSKTYKARNIIELPNGDSGIPTAYDKSWNSIFLTPIPNYNSTNGLKVIYTRGASYFTESDTTKTPGIPAIFHSYLVAHAARSYLADKIVNTKLTTLNTRIQEWEDQITEFYANRSKDEPTAIRFINRSSR